MHRLMMPNTIPVHVVDAVPARLSDVSHSETRKVLIIQPIRTEGSARFNAKRQQRNLTEVPKNPYLDAVDSGNAKGFRKCLQMRFSGIPLSTRTRDHP